MTVTTRRGGRGAGAALVAAGMGLLALTMGGGSAARAQEAKADQGIASYPKNPIALKVGIFLPTNGATRDDLGIDWLSYGASVDFYRTRNRVPQIFSVYADYWDETKTTGPSDSRLRSEAVMQGYGISDRYYFAPHLPGFQPYAGAGFGFYNVHAKRNGVGGYASEYKTSIGGKFMLGAEIREGLFAELSYNALPEPKLTGSRIKVSGYQIAAGFRF